MVKITTEEAVVARLSNRATRYTVALIEEGNGYWVFPSIGRAKRFDASTSFESLAYVMSSFGVSEGDAEGIQMALKSLLGQ